MSKFKVLADYIAENYKGKIVEVGVGGLYEVADVLRSRGLNVLTVDVNPRRGDTIKDDATRPNLKIYEGASLIYSIRPPYEIQSEIVKIGKTVGCDVIIVPLKSEIVAGGELKNFRGVQFYVFRGEVSV